MTENNNLLRHLAARRLIYLFIGSELVSNFVLPAIA